MRGLERITTVRLAEVISESGLVPTEQITEALYQQDATGITFVEHLIETGAASEWDCARQVVNHFQLPFLTAGNVEIDEEAVKCLPEDFLFEHNLLPFARIGQVLNLMMPVFTPHKVLAEAAERSGLEVFPFVGLGSENRKHLFQLFPDHPKERPVKKAKAKKDEDSSWESIFDLGDQMVHKELGGKD